MKKTNFRALFKGFFFISGIRHLIPANLLITLGQMAQLSLWISKQKKVAFSDFYNPVFDYWNRYKLYTNLLEEQGLNNAVDYLEFGVASGHSFRWWLTNINDASARFYGFDTFTGLPEDWGPYKKGDMSNNNAPPDISDTRVTFYQGLFQQTLPTFINGYNADRRKIIHLDADLYSSTLFVLTSLTPYIQKGDILIFDEFNVPMHEFKAFCEWVNAYYIDYEVLGGVNNFYQTAIIVK